MKSDKTTPNVPTLRFREFTDGWRLMPLKKLLCFQNGINADSDKYGKGVKFISVSDILNNQYITYDCIKGLIDIDEKTMEKFLVEYGDMLFQRSSETFEDIGRANVYLDKEHPATFGGFVIRGKKISEYNPLFFRYLLCTPNARKQTVRMGAGAQHYNIGQDGLGKISLYFPAIQEQQKIAAFLSAIDDRIAVQNKIIEDLKVLKKELNYSLIDRIINGKSSNCKIEDVIDYEQPTNYIVKSDKYIENGETPVLTANKAFLLGYTIENEGVYNKSDCIILDDFTLDFKYVNFPFKIKSSAIKILTAKKDIELRYFYEYLLFLGLTSHEHKRHYISEIAPLPLYLPSIDEQRNALSALNSISEKIKVEENYIIALKAQKCFFLRAMFI